jgi:hypothetical protein
MKLPPDGSDKTKIVVVARVDPDFTADLVAVLAVFARFQRHNRSIPSFWDSPSLAKT